jgi:hypothetical protein
MDLDVNASQQPPSGEQNLVNFASSRLAIEALVLEQAIKS